MLILFLTICFFTHVIIGNSTVNNELVRDKYATKKDKQVSDFHSHDLTDAEYGYVVTLVQIKQMIVTTHCTGSMIHKNWILSSAHCFYDLTKRKFYAWYGNFTVSPLVSELYSEVAKIFIHPEFLNTAFTSPGYFFGDNDISLLRVGKVSLPKYGRLSTIDHTKMHGLRVKYIGGAPKSRSDGEMRPLQIGEGVVVGCGMALTRWSKYALCVTPKCSQKLHQPLHGDMGGPFLYDGKIVGVMSSSYQIPKTLLSSNGLTPVSPYRDWVEKVRESFGKANETKTKPNDNKAR
uniref:Peptidase S1 domain-containing protein n=1 Tax=Heliothis virescens TaxID=7102 RepID=A0A2A4K7Q0_HELVI